MINAHLNTFMTLITPFVHRGSSDGGIFDFATATAISDRVRSEIPTMLRERLTPPPDEAYSLHRKLSGCFLLCTRLGARVKATRIFEDNYRKYQGVAAAKLI